VILLAIALGGRAASLRIRAGLERFRIAFGVVIAAVAFALVFNLDEHLAKLDNPLSGVLDRLGAGQLHRGTNVTARKPAQATEIASLPDYGPAPDFAGISQWYNSPPLTLAKLRGKVVLVDFWTYSCINCLRTLPHLEAWDRMYRSKGLVIVGVHTPEFSFEADKGNVGAAVKRLGVKYPVALDPNYDTWNRYGNQYWPAEYLIDKQGHVRHADFGEGSYNETEGLIRKLLGEKPGSPASNRLADLTPSGPITPETYLGYQRQERITNGKLYPDKLGSYSFPKSLGKDDWAYAGEWKVGPQEVVAGKGAALRLRYYARKVYIVLGGHGRVQVLVDGKQRQTIPVTADKLYTVVDEGQIHEALLELRFTPGVDAYSFTFG
jgi:thiol-disulfide isomerase/thioredoxin